MFEYSGNYFYKTRFHDFTDSRLCISKLSSGQKYFLPANFRKLAEFFLHTNVFIWAINQKFL